MTTSSCVNLILLTGCHLDTAKEGVMLGVTGMERSR